MRIRLTQSATDAAFYYFSTALLAIVGVIFIPIQLDSMGIDRWSTLAFGQSVGTIVSVVVGLGWQLDGPSRIGRMEIVEATREYFTSVALRLILASSTFAILVILFQTNVVDLIWALGFLLPVSTALLGGWYYVGRRQPRSLVMFETIPRVLFSIVAMVVMIHGEVELALGIQILGVLAAAVVESFQMVYVTRRYGFSFPSVSDFGLHRFRSQLFPTGTLLLGAFSISFPLTFLGISGSTTLGQFAIIDKFIKQSVTFSTPLVQVLQGHIASAPLNRKLTLSLLFTRVAAASASFGIVFYAIMSLLMPLLSSGTYNSGNIALGISAIYCSINLGNRLIANAILTRLQRNRAGFTSALFGLSVSMTAFAIASYASGHLEMLLIAMVIGDLASLTIRTMTALRSGPSD